MTGRATALLVLAAALYGQASAYRQLEVQSVCRTWAAQLSSDTVVSGAAVLSISSEDTILLELEAQKGYELRGAAQLEVQQDVGSMEAVSLTLSTPPCFGATCGRAMELRTSSSNVQKVAAAAAQGRASISMALAADSNIMLHGLLQPDCPEPSGPQLSPVELVVMEGISALLGQLPASWRGDLKIEAFVEEDDAMAVETTYTEDEYTVVEVRTGHDAMAGPILCPLSQAPQPYVIPPSCTGVQDRLLAHCGLAAQSVALASGFLYPGNAQQDAGFEAGRAICVPQNCDPCEVEKRQARLPWPSFGVTQQGPRCGVKGYSTEYIVPPDCHNFAEQAERMCGLSLADLVSPDYVPSPHLLGPWDSVCLPADCEPCRNATVMAQEPAQNAEPEEQQQPAASWLETTVNGVHAWVRARML